MNAWWQSLSARDQRMLLWGAWISAALLFWAFLWDPAQVARRELQPQLVQAEADLAYMQSAVAQLSKLRSGGTATVFDRAGRSLLALADASARDARLGHAVKRIEPVSSGRVNVWLEAAEFDQVAVWLEQLQSAYGIRVDEYALQRAPGDGKVDGRVSLMEPAGQ